ncbi:MAG TPA: helix-turn-helix domain-containing protein [Bacteroidota bacterium]|nr:helix-turn-helix domain-containing protein [Bacteroidota bacterium]
MRRVPEVDEIVQRIVKKMRPWGITLSYLAQCLGVSRQYSWQIIHYRTLLSRQRALEIEKEIDRIIDERAHLGTFGDRLRAARISAGYTLKEVAAMIGYTWVGVERWEKNLCVPKPSVLWHLCNLYCVGEDWFKESFPSANGSRSGGFRYEHRMGIRGELAAMYLTPISGGSATRAVAPESVKSASLHGLHRGRRKNGRSTGA